MVDLNIAHIKGLHVQTYQFQMFQEWITLREENAKLEELIATLQSELADEQEKSMRRIAELRACIAELCARNAILTVELERAAWQ